MSVPLESLSLLMPQGTIAASAATYENLSYDYLDDSTIEIADCPTSATGDLEIPSEIDGVAVTSIARWAFYGCDDLATITIPDSVTSIGDYVFYSCDSLTFIIVDDNNSAYCSV
ncbi:MAG: leucine-rich repeat domain-containing protein, partial [Ruminococcus sp.]|nr:leucine-rich repeat domain-containing protein [Ruminococcus sp.]